MQTQLKSEVKVLRTIDETKETEVLTMKEAIYSLSGYWQEDKIEAMLLKGVPLWTPYAEYKIIKP